VGDARWHHLANIIEPSKCSGDAACCQVTLTTCAVISDFHRIGGFHILPSLLSSRHAELRWRAAELIATLTQNNPYCQSAVLEVKLLPQLMELLDNASEDEQVRVKALYAVSCKLPRFVC